MGTGSNYLVRVFDTYDYDCMLADNFHYMFDVDKSKYSKVLERKINFYTFLYDDRNIIINIYVI